MGPAFFEGKYTIGYWHWELPELPDAWIPSFDGLDEVWVPTQFVLTAVSEKSPVPVVRIPHAVSFSTRSPSRPRLDSPRAASCSSRCTIFSPTRSGRIPPRDKGVSGRVRAERRGAARGQGDERRQVPRRSGGAPGVSRGSPGTVLLTETLSRQDVYDLEATCDAFVSLHRSEGFGLGMAESMYLGKPVVATNWSGNVDFMNHGNSCPVDYELVTLSRDHGPYAKGQRWADADVDHAAFYMKKLVTDAGYAARLGAKARELIRAEYSPAQDRGALQGPPPSREDATLNPGPETAPSGGRLHVPSVDGLRGASALLVVAYHCGIALPSVLHVAPDPPKLILGGGLACRSSS